MTMPPTAKGNARGLLHTFVYGSLLVLLLCLCATALIFSATYLKKERSRADISSRQLMSFFDFQYRAIAEEMWTRNYEAINLRVAEMSRQLGNASHELVLADERGACLYSSGAGCELPGHLKDQIPAFEAKPQAVLRFDGVSKRYIYMVPVHVGAIHKGYLFAAISDPYDFYRGGRFTLALKTFIAPIACMILAWLLWLVISQRLILRPYLSALLELERKQAVGELAAHVVHDIRSPLVALKSVITGFQGLDEAQRRLITAAASRIENIANDLIAQFTGKGSSETEPFSFLWPIIDSIVAEKRAMLGEKTHIEIVCELPNDLSLARVPISATKLSRVLSNLLNNAIEALRERPKGFITIAATSVSQRVLLSIEDNGKGIPADLLHKLRTVGGSYQKSEGAGIGLQQAKAALARARGALSIDSAPGQGTTVTLELPSAPLPAWCAKALDLSDAKTVVVLDDDQSVHLLWKQRLGEDGIVSLTDPEQFSIARFPPGETRYILDHEICGSPVTGLDLIMSHKLAERAVLVTSYFNEPKIQRAVELAGARMLPKFMISGVKIRGWALRKESPLVSPRKRSCDLVLIDDDLLVHDVWRMAAARQGKVLQAAATPAALSWSELDRETPIYIDKNLGELSGITVARELHAKGFTNISLATGENFDRSEVPNFIREVRSKEFPLQV